MTRARFLYVLLGVLLVAGAAYSSHRGSRWFLGPSLAEVRNVPKSVRDNPGSYRPVYSGGGRYRGGK